MIELTRRRLLIGFFAVASGGSGTLWGCRPRGPEFRSAVLAVADLVGLIELAPKASATYRESHEDAADPTTLFRSIFGDTAPPFDSERLRSALTDRISRDFAEGETVELDGWLLSRSEARFTALVAALSGA